MDDSDDFFNRFFGSRTGEALLAHVLREVAAGRDLADILEDPYVTNRASHDEIRALLDHAEISKAVGDEAIASIRSKM
jgi:hypothetical protein